MPISEEVSPEVTTSSARKRKWLIVAGVLLGLIIAGIAVKRVGAGGSSHAAVEGGGAAVYAAVAPVKRETVADSLSIAGQFMPYQNVELHAKEAGYIKKIYVDIGDRVHAGQVLAVLEIPELVAQVDEAKAAVHHAEEEIQRSQGELSRAEANHVALHSNAARLVDADKARPGLIAQQELDDATAKDRAAEAQIDAAKSGLGAAKQQLEVARANRQRYSALNDYARITAPYDGVVTWRFSDTGALVQAGTSSSTGSPVVTLAQVDVLRLRIPVPESLAAKVKVGDTADVHVQATGEHFTGKVARLTGALDPSTRTMQVEIDVPNDKYKLAPGMYADVQLQVQSHKDALTVPMQAVQRNNGKVWVLLVDSQDRVQLRDIQTGVEDPTRVEVLGGLAEGDRVIVGNFASYQPGETVHPKASPVVSIAGEAGGGTQ